MAPKKLGDRPEQSVKSKTSEQKTQSSTWLSFFHFGESYSSLLLGIVVVIITTILLIFLVKDRNVSKTDTQKGVSSTQTQQTDDNGNVNKLARENITPTATSKLTATLVPTTKPTVTKKPTVKPSAIPTITTLKKPTATITPLIKSATATPVPTKKIAMQITSVPQNKNIKIHIVTSGENLWTISEKYFKSGYNWVDISRANKLSNPGLITTGMKLTIPNVTPKTATVITQTPTTTEFGPKITAATYTVTKGDHLWGIAVRAYNDGYKWVEIARVNKISNPNIIHIGLVLKLPKSPGSNIK